MTETRDRKVHGSLDGGSNEGGGRGAQVCRCVAVTSAERMNLQTFAATFSGTATASPSMSAMKMISSPDVRHTRSARRLPSASPRASDLCCDLLPPAAASMRGRTGAFRSLARAGRK